LRRYTKRWDLREQTPSWESIAVVSAVGNGSGRSLGLSSLYVFRKGAEVPARDYGFSLLGSAADKSSAVATE